MASVILGALAALGITFFLGFSLGHGVLQRPAPAPAAAKPPADPLAALDQPARPDGGEAVPRLSFHETLTSNKLPPERLPPAAKTQPAIPKANAQPEASVTAASAPPAAAPVSRPGAPALASAVVSATAATASRQVTRPAAALDAPAAAAPPKAVREGAFVVQVGATPDRFEAERLALKFRGRGAKVSSADVPGKGRWYRVRFGPFENREAAERYLRELERTAGAKGFVTSANARESP